MPALLLVTFHSVHMDFKLVFLLRYERLQKICSIALVGKYTKLRDCYASVFKALEHSALAINHKLNLMVSRSLLFQLSGYFIFSYVSVSLCECVHVSSSAQGRPEALDLPGVGDSDG